MFDARAKIRARAQEHTQHTAEQNIQFVLEVSAVWIFESFFSISLLKLFQYFEHLVKQSEQTLSQAFRNK